MLRAKQAFQFEGNETLLGRLHFLGDLRFGFAEFDQHFGVGDAFVEVHQRIEFAADGVGFVHRGAGFVLVRPERRLGHDVFEFD